MYMAFIGVASAHFKLFALSLGSTMLKFCATDDGFTLPVVDSAVYAAFHSDGHVYAAYPRWLTRMCNLSTVIGLVFQFLIQPPQCVPLKLLAEHKHLIYFIIIQY